MGKVKAKKKAVAVEPDRTRQIHIIGAGGVGFWTAVGLMRVPTDEVVVYDTDDLQEGLGFGRLPRATPTTKKVNLLRGFGIVNIGGRVPRMVDRLFGGSEAGPGDLVVDCSDMSGVRRREVYEAVKKSGARYLRVSYDGQQSVVVISEGMPIVTDEEAAGYEAVPTLALSLLAGGMAAEVVAKTNWADAPFTEFQVSVAELAGWIPRD